MRLFVLSAVEYITDHELNGEGQIAFNLLNTLSERGHEVVACVQENRISRDTRFEVAELRRSPRFASLGPIDYARAACSELKRRGRPRLTSRIGCLLTAPMACSDISCPRIFHSWWARL
jgi:hypothetical protein